MTLVKVWAIFSCVPHITGTSDGIVIHVSSEGNVFVITNNDVAQETA